jgi:hypothetical protein
MTSDQLRESAATSSSIFVDTAVPSAPALSHTFSLLSDRLVTSTRSHASPASHISHVHVVSHVTPLTGSGAARGGGAVGPSPAPCRARALPPCTDGRAHAIAKCGEPSPRTGCDTPRPSMNRWVPSAVCPVFTVRNSSTSLKRGGVVCT